MLNTFEVSKRSFSSQAAGKLLVPKQENDCSMVSEYIIFHFTRAVAFDGKEKSSVNVNDCIIIESKLRINLINAKLFSLSCDL